MRPRQIGPVQRNDLRKVGRTQGPYARHGIGVGRSEIRAAAPVGTSQELRHTCDLSLKDAASLGRSATLLEEFINDSFERSDESRLGVIAAILLPRSPAHCCVLSLVADDLSERFGSTPGISGLNKES